MEKRDVAQWLAEKGFHVVPLIEGGKIPKDKGWQEIASSCPDTVYKLWSTPDEESQPWNVGVVGKDHIILDVDVPGESHQIDGLQSLAGLGWQGRTWTVKTPTGGLHLYFKKPAGRDYSQTDLAPGINVRSTGGYVVGPFSETKYIPGKQAAGKYRLIDQTPPAELPECIAFALTPAGSSARFNEASYSGQWDHPHSVEWCWRYIHEWSPKASKGVRGRTGLEIAHVLGDRAISKPTALVMLQEWHASKCDPPDDDENQMESVLNSAYSNRQKPFGSDCAHDYLEAVELPRSVDPPAQQPLAQRPFEQRVRKSRVRCAADIANIPRIPWLVKGKLIRGAITGLVSPPGVGKSTLTLQWACALAIGDGAFTGLTQLQDAPPTNSLVVGIEDTAEVMESRLAAMCTAFGLDFEDIADRVHLYSGLSDGPLTLLAKKDRRSMLGIAEDLARLQAYVHAHKIDCVFVDPLVEVHDGEENDNGEMRRVMAALRSLASTTGAAVVVVHHTRKPPQASSESYAGDQFAGRGASSIPAAFRVGMTLFTMGPKDGELYNIPEEYRHNHVRLDDSKSNWSGRSPNAQWFVRVEIPLANGESAAILRPKALAPTDDKSGELMANDIAELLTLDVPASLASVAAALLSKPAYRDKSERTIRRRIRDALAAGSAGTTRGLLKFTASGKEGGTLVLTQNI